jgi:RNA polymerase primary sigma factor
MVNGEMEYEERCKVLADFEHRRIQVIAAPRVLDEGIDIPEADLGLIIAGSASRRQLIQRLGRVIRKKSDGRAARIYVLFVEETREDPESSAREDTVTELQAHARSVTVLRSRDRVG